jgi:hypothetical protein
MGFSWGNPERVIGTPRHIWDDDTKIGIRLDWIYLA